MQYFFLSRSYKGGLLSFVAGLIYHITTHFPPQHPALPGFSFGGRDTLGPPPPPEGEDDISLLYLLISRTIS